MQKLGALARPKGVGWIKVFDCKSRKHVHFCWRIVKRKNYLLYIRKVGGLSKKIPYELWCKKPDHDEIPIQELNSLIEEVTSKRKI